MSDFPAPGQPPVPPPGWGAQPPAATPPGPWGAPAGAAGQGPWLPPPGFPPPRPVHKPGVIPLRPLGLGDMYDAAFKVIRHNAKATAGAAALVSGITMAVPLLVTAAVTPMLGGVLSADGATPELDGSQIAALIAAGASFLVGSIAQMLGLALVTGMVAQVTHGAALGRTYTLGEAWAATRGVRLRLIGLSLLLGLGATLLLAAYVAAWVPVVMSREVALIVGWGLVTVPVFLVAMVWLWVRAYYFASVALVIERTGVLAAVGRAFRLTSAAFWRTFGIALLTAVIAQVGGSMLAMPFSLGSQFVPLAVDDLGVALLIAFAMQALGTVVSAVFVVPFMGAVSTTQYLDLRIRKEAYDVELVASAGLAGR